MSGMSGARPCRFWLIKSEPSCFSWDEQVKNRVEPWTGVRNYQARNNLAAMKKGDRALFYHSITGKRIMGVVRVVREGYPDPTAREGQWVCVDVEAELAFRTPVPLERLKKDPRFGGLSLIRQPRLSVGAVSGEEFSRIVEMGDPEKV